MDDCHVFYRETHAYWEKNAILAYRYLFSLLPISKIVT